MKLFLTYTLIISVLLFSGCSDPITIEQLKRFAPTENYPDDTFLDTLSNKTALIIVAHDDDDCAMSGTIAKLTADGWYIKQISLQKHIISETGDNPAKIICDGNELILEDGFYRLGLDTIGSPYLPIPLHEINEQFLTKKVSEAIIQITNTYNPSVIFSLDNIKGGYGHPEHIFISQLIVDLYNDNKINPKRIYQSVYTNSMEKEIVDNWLAARLKKWGYPNASDMANQMYGIDGMPEPDVQIYITEVADKKMEYLMSYDENVRKNLRKFIPYYEEFDAQTYFSVFDREFFRVIEK